MHTPTTTTNGRGPGDRHRSSAHPHISNKHTHGDPPSHGLRAQLQNLLPRHALFHAHVQIHQISSVPLVHGEFAARWKFKNVQSQTGLLKRVAGKRRGSQKDEKGKSEADSLGSADAPVDHSSSGNSTTEEQSPGVPSVVVSGYPSPVSTHFQTSYPNLLPPDFSRTNSSAVSSSSASNSQSVPSVYLAPSLNMTSTDSASNSSSAMPSPSVENYSTSRGITPFYKLKDHAVVWDHGLDVIIKMDVDRETSELLPNEFKLVIMQRVISGDPDAPKNPRLGALYLNLSEYAGVGKEVTRRYLLSDSKMNATIKLTILLEHVGGDTNYIAPLLPKGEILNGVTDLLEDDVHLTRPRDLDLWGPYHNQQEMEMDLLGGTSIPELQSAAAGKNRSKSRTRARSRIRHGRMPSNGKNSMMTATDLDSDADFHVDDEEDSDLEEPRYEVPFDVSRLPLAYGPKTTEMLIEAIFNPVRVTNHDSRGNPFTYYMSPEEVMKEELVHLERRKQRDRATSQHAPSLYSVDDNSSGHAGSHENDAQSRGRTGGSGVRGWWSRKKFTPSTPTGSRPATPVAVR